MTFSALAQYVAANAAPDGDSAVAIPSQAGPFISSPFGMRLAMLVRRFTRDVPLLYATKAAIAIPADLREYSLIDPANTALAFYEVHDLWVNDHTIRRASSAGEVMRQWTTSGPVGAPTVFAHVTKSKLVFDAKPSAGLPGCYARGFYRHPAITLETQVIDPELEDVLDLFDRYAQANLRQDAAGDEIGLARLQRVDKQAYDGLMKIRGERMRAILETRRCF